MNFKGASLRGVGCGVRKKIGGNKSGTPRAPVEGENESETSRGPTPVEMKFMLQY